VYTAVTSSSSFLTEKGFFFFWKKIEPFVEQFVTTEFEERKIFFSFRVIDAEFRGREDDFKRNLSQIFNEFRYKFRNSSSNDRNRYFKTLGLTLK